MKKIIIFCATCLLVTFTCKAQCDKSVVWTSSKFEMVDTTGKVLETEEKPMIIETSKADIKFKGSEGVILSGTINNIQCDWKELYKNGKTVFKSVLEDPHGDTKHATITIEAIDGNITVTGEVDERPNEIIKVHIDKYEEKI